MIIGNLSFAPQPLPDAFSALFTNMIMPPQSTLLVPDEQIFGPGGESLKQAIFLLDQTGIIKIIRKDIPIAEEKRIAVGTYYPNIDHDDNERTIAVVGSLEYPTTPDGSTSYVAEPSFIPDSILSDAAFTNYQVSVYSAAINPAGTEAIIKATGQNPMYYFQTPFLSALNEFGR